jgi:hypothetical protein
MDALAVAARAEVERKALSLAFCRLASMPRLAATLSEAALRLATEERCGEGA